MKRTTRYLGQLDADELGEILADAKPRPERFVLVDPKTRRQTSIDVGPNMCQEIESAWPTICEWGGRVDIRQVMTVDSPPAAWGHFDVKTCDTVSQSPSEAGVLPIDRVIRESVRFGTDAAGLVLKSQAQQNSMVGSLLNSLTGLSGQLADAAGKMGRARERELHWKAKAKRYKRDLKEARLQLEEAATMVNEEANIAQVIALAGEAFQAIVQGRASATADGVLQVWSKMSPAQREQLLDRLAAVDTTSSDPSPHDTVSRMEVTP